MNKMIAFAVAAFSLNSAMACEPYFTAGFGPYAVIPNVGVGARFHDDMGKIDININYSDDRFLKTAQVSMSRLFFSDMGLYAGPSVGLSFHKLKYWGSGTESTLGLVLGKDFGDSFMDISCHKRMKWTKVKLDSTQVRFRIGVKF